MMRRRTEKNERSQRKQIVSFWVKKQLNIPSEERKSQIGSFNPKKIHMLLRLGQKKK